MSVSPVSSLEYMICVSTRATTNSLATSSILRLSLNNMMVCSAPRSIHVNRKSDQTNSVLQPVSVPRPCISPFFLYLLNAVVHLTLSNGHFFLTSFCNASDDFIPLTSLSASILSTQENNGDQRRNETYPKICHWEWKSTQNSGELERYDTYRQCHGPSGRMVYLLYDTVKKKCQRADARMSVVMGTYDVWAYSSV